MMKHFQMLGKLCTAVHVQLMLRIKWMPGWQGNIQGQGGHLWWDWHMAIGTPQSLQSHTHRLPLARLSSHLWHRIMPCFLSTYLNWMDGWILSESRLNVGAISTTFISAYLSSNSLLHVPEQRNDLWGMMKLSKKNSAHIGGIARVRKIVSRSGKIV